MQVTSIDVYVTYRCNLRCTHCFMGNSLDSAINFDYALLSKLIERSSELGAREITFLGGEPTLYPQIVEAVVLAQASNLRARIVTNGLYGFARFMKNFKEQSLPQIGFSIDGATATTHEAVRGKGTFERMLGNIAESRRLGYESFGIVSIGRHNMHETTMILDLCDQLAFTHVNLHYVTNRGLAGEDMVPSVSEWLDLVEGVTSHSGSLGLDVRLERTYAATSQHQRSCAVRLESNLMFLPDGRVFMCPLFIDVPGSHSFNWTDAGLIKNPDRSNTEVQSCSKKSAIHCPAMSIVNPRVAAEAQALGLEVVCALEKTRVRNGIPVDDDPTQYRDTP
jgi:MoaA/NifB/PqqE/SkfB family radical SAM enzyme